MSPQVRSRLFDPYFTTKPKGEGSGLGMAMVHGIVNRYGGGISVYSEEGRGTTVNIYLPRHGEMISREEGTVASPPAGGGTVLVVDDEPQLVAIEKQMLTRLGYRVTACHDSTEALEIFRNQPKAFDVVITDMSMPRMNGAAFSRAILAIRPDTPIILCTGYSADLTVERAHAIGVRCVLMKPVSMQTLAASLQEAIKTNYIPAR